MSTPERELQDRFTVLAGGPDSDDREERLIEGADELVSERRRGGSILGHPRFMISVAAALMVLGLANIIIGWAGAADATVVEEQVPYLISGGLLGLGLTIIGALTHFSHWLTVGIRESREREAARRADHAELMATLGSLTTALSRQEAVDDGTARSPRAQRPLRRAPRGS
jgi:hypothetical protein